MRTRLRMHPYVILDRILNNAHRLVLKGPTRRPDTTKEIKDTEK